MSIVIRHLADIKAYEGPHAIPGIRFRHAREEMGVSSWGMNVIELDPNNSDYPEHDHADDGHEEVYVVLAGAGVLVVGDEEHTLEQGQMVYVPGELKRKWVTRESALTVLALGGTPGAAYGTSMGS